MADKPHESTQTKHRALWSDHKAYWRLNLLAGFKFINYMANDKIEFIAQPHQRYEELCEQLGIEKPRRLFILKAASGMDDDAIYIRSCGAMLMNKDTYHKLCRNEPEGVCATAHELTYKAEDAVSRRWILRGMGAGAALVLFSLAVDDDPSLPPPTLKGFATTLPVLGAMHLAIRRAEIFRVDRTAQKIAPPEDIIIRLGRELEENYRENGAEGTIQEWHRQFANDIVMHELAHGPMDQRDKDLAWAMFMADRDVVPLAAKLIRPPAASERINRLAKERDQNPQSR